MLVDHSMCRDGGSEKVAHEAKSCKYTTVKRNYQTVLGSFLKFVQKHTRPLVTDGEIDGALVAYSNDCFLQGVLHHHLSQLPAAVIGHWPSFSHFVTRKLPIFHRCLKWWQLTPARFPWGSQHLFGKASRHNSPFSTNISWRLSFSSHR